MSSDHRVHVGDEQGKRGFLRKQIHTLAVPDLATRWLEEKQNSMLADFGRKINTFTKTAKVCG